MIYKNEIEFYQENAGKSYDKNSTQDIEIKDKLNVLLKKITGCAREARISLFGEKEDKEYFTPLPHVIESKKNSEIRSYLFARFTPKSKYSPIATYWFFVEGRPEHKDKHFRISLSLYDNNSSESLRQKCKSLQNEYKLEDSRSLESDISEEDLTQWIVNSIKSFEINYEDFCRNLQPDLDEALSKLSEKQNKKQDNIFDHKIWKMSHGKEKDISETDHEWLIDNSFIAIGYDPEHNQRRKFVKEMQDGDFFYLVRNTKIVLLGQIDGNEIINTTDHLNKPNWVMRKFKNTRNPISELDSKRILGREGWKPQNQSTINAVKKNDLVEFEKTILQPAFGLNLNDLMENKALNSINKHTDNEDRNNIQIPRNQILYGPPGTGKTFNTINLALSIADPAFESNDRDEVKKRFDKLVDEGQIVFTTFHQSMSYEDFIEGIKPETNENGVVTYEVKSGIFKEICNSASTPNKQGFEAAYKKLQEKLRDEISGFTEDKTLQLSTPRGKEFSVSLNSKGNLRLYTGKDKKNPQGVLTKENLQKQINGEDIWYGGYCKGVLRYLKENFGYSAENIDSDKNYVLIIDEINRGNVSQIFGELITLIEDGKRLGQEEALSVKLPYSKESERDFGVPSNVYIIGTMNTADRSVEALDAALRRRFSFIEMPPKPALIKTEGKLKDTDGILHIGELGKIDLANLLDVINKRIEKLLDSDHQIGHSFFLKVYDIESLKNEFQNKIIPLLKEYFYGDFGKLGLVLGEGFFENIETSDTSIFANFGNFDNNDFNERVIYKLKTISSNNGISGMSNEDFLDAINKLLNIKLP